MKRISHVRTAWILILLGVLLGLGSACGRRAAVDLPPGETLPEYRAIAPTADVLEPAYLTNFTSDELYGSLSPDGTYLAFASNQKGNMNIWVKDLRTGQAWEVTQNVAEDTQPRWVDDDRLVFVSMRYDTKGDLFFIDFDDREDKGLDPFTKRETGESFPVVGPLGEWLYYTSGPDAKKRIVRRNLKDLDLPEEAVTDWGTTHAALSPDNQYIAFTKYRGYGGNRIGQVVLKNMTTKKEIEVSHPSFNCGFPQFTPDGKTLIYSRWYFARRGQSLDVEDRASLWRVSLAEVLQKKKIHLINRVTEQLTSDRFTHLFTQAHAKGLVFTTKRNENLDVWMIPYKGLFPVMKQAEAQYELAMRQEDNFDRIFALDLLREFPKSELYQRACYEQSRLFFDLKAQDKQQISLNRLRNVKTAQGPWKALADIDQAVLPVYDKEVMAKTTGVRLEKADVDQAIEALESLRERYEGQSRAESYILLRRADMEAKRSDYVAANNYYQRVLQGFPNERESGVEAMIGLGRVMSLLNDTEEQVRFFINAFRQYPEFPQQLVKAGDEIFRLYDNPDDRINEIDRLRYHIDHNQDLSLFIVLAQTRIGELYADLGMYDLAIRAMQEILSKHDTEMDLKPLRKIRDKQRKGESLMKLEKESYEKYWKDFPLKEQLTQATFKLGEFSTRYGASLREQGRALESKQMYLNALDQFERVTFQYRSNQRNYLHAYNQFMRISLLLSKLYEGEKEWGNAKQVYERTLEFDRGYLQAHRRLIAIRLSNLKQDKLGKNGEVIEKGEDYEDAWDELFEPYNELADENEGDWVSWYAMGYLMTWRRPLQELKERDLAWAEEYLLNAAALNPQHPLIHNTLGYVYEMQDKVMGDNTPGLISMAVEEYDKAKNLNDRNLDIQSEGDISLNLGNVFIALGNQWLNAYKTYRYREELNVPFESDFQKLFFLINFGRAAYTQDDYTLSARKFEQALDLAGNAEREYTRANLKRHAKAMNTVRGELVARLALIYQEMGEYDASTRFFLESRERFEKEKKRKMLSGITRSVAYNNYLKGDYAEAIKYLLESAELRKKYGTSLSEERENEFTLLPLVDNASSSPLGFSPEKERNLNKALRNRILEEYQVYIRGIPLLKGAYEEKKKTFEDKPDDMLNYIDMILLGNRLALHAYAQGMPAEAVENLYLLYRPSGEVDEETVLDTEQMQENEETEEMEYVLQTVPFRNQLRPLLNAASMLVRQGAEGIPVSDESLRKVQSALKDLIVKYEKDLEAGGNAGGLEEDFVLHMFNTGAALSMTASLQESRMPLSPELNEEESFQAMQTRLQGFSDAYRYWKKVLELTPVPEEEGESEPSRALGELNTLPPTERYKAYWRMRYRAQALMNMAEFLAMFETPEEQASLKHVNDENDIPTATGRSMQYLKEAMRLMSGLRDMTYTAEEKQAMEKERADAVAAEAPLPPVRPGFWLGELRYQAMVAFAARTGNLKLAQQAVTEFSGLYPKLLGPEYQRHAWQVRSDIYKTAIRLAEDQDKHDLALTWSEWYLRRTVLDELFKTPFKFSEKPIQAIFDEMDKTSQVARATIQMQNPYRNWEFQDLRQLKIDDLLARLQSTQAQLAKVDPRTAMLMSTSMFSPKDAGASLSDGEMAVFALPLGPDVQLFAVDHTGAVTTKRLNHAVRNIHTWLSEETLPASRLVKTLMRPMLSLVKGAKFVYFGVDLLDAKLPLKNLLVAAGQPGLQYSRVLSLRGLADSQANRNVFVNTGLATAGVKDGEHKAISAKKITKLLEPYAPAWTTVTGKDVVFSNVKNKLWNNGLLFLGQPLYFEGHSIANARVYYQEELVGIGHYRFVDQMNFMPKSNLVVFTNVHQGQTRAGFERLFMETMLNYRGVPGFAMINRDIVPAATVLDWFGGLVKGIKDKDRVRSWSEALVEAAQGKTAKRKKLNFVALSDAVAMYGYRGMSNEERQAFSKTMLEPTIGAAKKAKDAKQWLKAIELLEKALAYMDYLNEPAKKLAVLDALVQTYQTSGRYPKAIEKQQIIVQAAQAAFDGAEGKKAKMGKMKALVGAKKSLVDLYTLNAQYDEALQENQSIIDFVMQLFNNKAFTYNFINQRGKVLERAGRAPEAVTVYKEAYDIGKAAGAKGAAKISEQSNNLGRVYLNSQVGKPEQSLASYTEALRFAPKMDGKAYAALDVQAAKIMAEGRALAKKNRKDPRIAGMVNQVKAIKEQQKGFTARMNIILGQARAYFTMGNFQKALDLAGTVKAEAQTAKVAAMVISANQEMFKAYSRQGNFPAALRIVDANLQNVRQQKILAKDQSVEVQLQLMGKELQQLNSRGPILTDLGRFDEAEASLSEALGIEEELAARGRANPVERSIALGNLGMMYRKKGDFANAYATYTRALGLNSSMNDKIGLMFTYGDLALAEEGMGRKFKALDNHQEAITRARALKSAAVEVRSLLGLARIHMSLRRLDEAKKALDDGMTVCQSKQMRAWMWKYHLEYGRYFRLKKDMDTALDHFNQGLAIIEVESGAKRPLSMPVTPGENDKMELYDEALRILLEKETTDEAFALYERMKARAYLDMVGSYQIHFADDQANALIPTIERSRFEMISLTAKMEGAAEEEKAALREALQKAQEDHRQALASLREINPELPAYVGMDVQNADALVSKLPEGTVMVAYYQGYDQLAIWVLDGSGLSMTVQKHRRSQTEKAVETFRKLMSNFHPVEPAAQTLYTMLVEPVKDKLAGKRVVVVPHGMLHFVPFAALHDGQSFLLDKQVFTYLSSANQLRWLKPGVEIKNMVAMGLSEAAGRTLQDLPFASQEVKSFGVDLKGSRILLEKQATETALKSLVSKPGYLHVATHVDVDFDNPFASAIQLYPDALPAGRLPEDSSPMPAGWNDGKVTVGEVLGMKVSANLVALSGCETALGPLSGGDSVVGLNRALLTAGAEQVISSLWRISDLSTAVMMKHFFRQYRENRDVAASLQQAQKKAAVLFPHPAYWAGFRLEGRPL